MNKLSVLLLTLFFIKLNLSVECDRYLVSAPVVVPGVSRTYVIDIYTRDKTCDVPIIVDDTVDEETKETLTIDTKRIIYALEEPEEYSIQIDSINVSLGFPYCKKYVDLDGTDSDFPYGQGNGTRIPWNLVENYTKTDSLGVKTTEIETISTYVSINKDTSYQFKVNTQTSQNSQQIRNYINTITSDEQTDNIVETATTYDIGNVATYGTYSVAIVITGNELTNNFQAIGQSQNEYINYNIFSNGTEHCWYGYVNTKKIKSSVYADCSIKDGNLKTTNWEIHNKYELDVDICRQLLSNKVAIIKDTVRYRMTVVFDISITDYTFPTDYYETVKTAQTKISYNLYPINNFCLIDVIQPTDDTKTLTCTISSNQLGNGDVYVPFQTGFSSLIYDEYLFFGALCSSIDITCTTTVVSNLNVLAPLLFVEIDPDNLNSNKTITTFWSSLWEKFYSLDLWTTVIIVVIILFLWKLIWMFIKWLFKTVCYCMPCRQIKACWDTCWLNRKRLRAKTKNGELLELTTMDILDAEEGKLGMETQTKIENLNRDEEMKRLIQENENLKKTNGNGNPKKSSMYE